MAVFNEQVENIEKTKASIVKVVSCCTIAKAIIQERKSDVHINPS